MQKMANTDIDEQRAVLNVEKEGKKWQKYGQIWHRNG